MELAQSLNAKLQAQEEQLARQKALYPDLPVPVSAQTEPEEAAFIRSSLARLGLPSVAVTQDMMKDDKEYHDELAKELAGLLMGIGQPVNVKQTIKTMGEAGSRAAQRGLMGDKGVIGLDEVWCGWNRARGVGTYLFSCVFHLFFLFIEWGAIALLPPSTLISVLPYLPQHTNPPIQHRKFPTSGLSVLHTPQYSNPAFTARLVSSLTMSAPKSSVDVSMEEGISVALVEEMIADVEGNGGIMRDEQAGYGVKWWPNIMKDLEYDGS